MRLAIGVIVTSGYRPETDFLFGRAGAQSAEGFYALQAHLQSGQVNRAMPRDRQLTGLRLVQSRKFPTDVARNEICQAVLDGDEDYLLFLDADMVHPATLVESLLAADKPVITARYHLKKEPFAAIAYVKHRTQEGPHRYASVHFGTGVFEIERAGAGALLIRRDVLQGIQARQRRLWAQALDETGALPPDLRNLLDVPPDPVCQWFRYQRAPEKPHDMTVSEDFWFFQQAREAGFSCWINWDVECPHIGSMAIDGAWNQPFVHKQVSEHTDPKVRDTVLSNTIVCGYPGGMQLGDDPADHVAPYVITAGER